ncbi:hypothetical protein BABINDRAFT_43333, partial [Babjeviella inositovora NRRL Y-12698]
VRRHQCGLNVSFSVLFEAPSNSDPRYIVDEYIPKRRKLIRGPEAPESPK